MRVLLAHRLLPATVALGLVLCPRFAFAGEEDGGVEPEYETVITGHKPRPTDEATGFAETIEVKDEVKTFSSVSEALSDSVGVRVRSAGGTGSYSTVSIRGSSSAQVPVFLDGVQLNAGGFSSVNLGDLSLDSLESMEIYRGSAPVFLGSGIGGAVLLKTREFEEPATEAALSLGSWGTMRLFLLRGDKIGDVSGLALFSAAGSEGDFEYLDTNGTVVANEDDDTVKKRENNHHSAYGGLVKLEGDKGAWNWLVLDDLFAKQQGLAFVESASSLRTELHASLRNLRNVLAARVSGPLSESARLFVDANYLTVSEDFSDSEGELFGLPIRVQSSTGAVGGSAVLEAGFSKSHESAVRASSRYEKYEQTLIGGQGGPSSSQRLGAELGIGHKWTVWRSLSVLPALGGEIQFSDFDGGLVPGTPFEFEPYSLFDYYVVPSLGARYDVIDGLTLRANAGRYVRAPDLSELFGYSGAVLGNPELSAEVGYNADAGATCMFERLGPVDFLRMDAAWFATWARDLIAYVQNSQDTVRPENMESAVIQGMEAALGVSFFDLISLSGNYTYLRGINTSDVPYYSGKYIPGRPRHEVYAKLDVGGTFEHWSAGIWFDTEYMGKGFLTPDNDEENEFNRCILGLGGKLEYLEARLTLTVDVENLLDTITMENGDGDMRPIRDFRNNPLPGRTVLATLHWRI